MRTAELRIENKVTVILGVQKTSDVNVVITDIFEIVIEMIWVVDDFNWKN